MKRLATLALIVLVVALLARQAAKHRGKNLVAQNPETQSVSNLVPTLPTQRKPAVTEPARIVAKTPSTRLQEALKISQKVLPTKADLEALHAAWADEELLSLASGRLLHISEMDGTPEAQDRRLQSIDFLDGAALWDKNPRRQQAVQAIQDVLGRDVSSLELPLDLKRSLAGDTIELYAVLLQADEERARDLYQRAGATQRDLFNFGKNMLGQNFGKQNRERES